MVIPVREMGIGPVFAVPKLLKRHGLTMDDIDIVELNEAFASLLLCCQRELGIPNEKLNPSGGSMSISHPFGMTGSPYDRPADPPAPPHRRPLRHRHDVRPVAGRASIIQIGIVGRARSGTDDSSQRRSRHGQLLASLSATV